MFWSLELDDFKGTFCNAGKYPLLKSIHKSIIEMAPKENTGPDDRSTTTTPSTTPIDFHKHHNTNKNGINFYDMENNSFRMSVTYSLLLILIVCNYMLW